MALTQPTLDGNALPWPSGYEERRGFRRAATEMADGRLHFDLVDDDAKRGWKLSWVGLDDSERTAVETAFDALRSSSVAFVDIAGDSYTVTAEGADELTWAYRLTAAGARYSASMTLREV